MNKKPYAQWSLRKTKPIFNRDLFYRDFKLFIYNSDKSLTDIAYDLNIGKMAMTRYFRKIGHKIDVNDFLVFCEYMGKDINDYISK